MCVSNNVLDSLREEHIKQFCSCGSSSGGALSELQQLHQPFQPSNGTSTSFGGPSSSIISGPSVSSMSKLTQLGSGCRKKVQQLMRLVEFLRVVDS